MGVDPGLKEKSINEGASPPARPSASGESVVGLNRNDFGESFPIRPSSLHRMRPFPDGSFLFHVFPVTGYQRQSGLVVAATATRRRAGSSL